MGPLRLGVVSDTHLAPEGAAPYRWHNSFDFGGTAERLRRAVEHFASEAVDGVVFLGDLAQRGYAEQRDVGLPILLKAPGGLWIARGNHDVDDDEGFRTEEAEPIRDEQALAGDVRLTVVEVGSTTRGASFRACSVLDVEGWGNDFVLIASHFPMISRAGELARLGFPYPGDLVNREALLEALVARSAPTVVLSGHLHIRDACSSGPVLQLYFPALVEHPFECSIIELSASDNGFRLTRIAIPLHTAPFLRDPVFVPSVQDWEFDGKAWGAS